MNAYKSQKKRQEKQTITELVEEAMEKYVEHADLIALMVLHNQFGFGSRRLKQFYSALAPMFARYKFYMADNDKTKFGEVDKRTGEVRERDDTWVLKRDLKEIGFDYDAVVAELLEEKKSDEYGTLLKGE